MKLLKGCKLIELTDDRIVQEFRFGETGVIRMIGNPNPDPVERQKIIDNVAMILYRAKMRRAGNGE